MLKYRVVLDSPGLAAFFSGEARRKGERRSGDQPGVLMSREPTEDEASVRVPALLSMWRKLPSCLGDEGVGEPYTALWNSSSPLKIESDQSLLIKSAFCIGAILSRCCHCKSPFFFSSTGHALLLHPAGGIVWKILQYYCRINV